MDVVDAHRRRHDLGLVVPPLREQRPDRPVDHARGEDPFLGGPALTLEEAAGDLPGGVHALLDVNGQGQKVHVARIPGGGGAEHHRVAGADDDRAACLLGELAGLEADLGAGDLYRGTVN
jgi:hypothetical protein